jgi:hypothetical protein
MLMAKKLSFALAVLVIAIVAWGLFLGSNYVTTVINGQPVTAPLDALSLAHPLGYPLGFVAITRRANAS